VIAGGDRSQKKTKPNWVRFSFLTLELHLHKLFRLTNHARNLEGSESLPCADEASRLRRQKNNISMRVTGAKKSSARCDFFRRRRFAIIDDGKMSPEFLGDDRSKASEF